MPEKTGMRQNKRRLPVLGITGGIGAGKSTVLSYLKERTGALLLMADEVGHRVESPGEPCYDRILETFGSGVTNPDGSLNRETLGALVYGDRTKLERLNAIVHPAVKERIRSEIEKAGCLGEVPFAVVEAALLLEDHYDQICDQIWYIYADESVRESRLAASRGYSREKTRGIMANQLSKEDFASRCDVVIDNSSPDLGRMKRQVDRALRNFLGSEKFD